MLRRVGLPEVHARFAPWFLKSHKLRLGRWSATLFSRLEAAFFAQPERLSTLEQRMRAHQHEYAAVMRSEDANRALEPREKNQKMLRRAFRDCSFSPAEETGNAKTRPVVVDDKDDEVDKLELIPEIPLGGAAPPGLAPPVRGTLESLGKHDFFSYTGKWKRGEMAGSMGVYSFADGGKYGGEWLASAPNGAGTVVYPNGVMYTGAFVNGKFHGFGVMEVVATGGASSGFRYEGEFKNGVRNGRGTLLFLSTGVKYEGEFYLNKRHGKGTETSSLGYSYTGEWRENRLCGKGYLLFPDGKTRVYRTDWPPLVLGEAIRLVKREQLKAKETEKQWYRSLLRVRDDLRALDLQMVFWDAEEARLAQEDEERLAKLKQARRDKREAQAAAKHAFLERAQQEAKAGGEGSNENEDEDEEEEEEDDGEEESGGEDDKDEKEEEEEADAN